MKIGVNKSGVRLTTNCLTGFEHLIDVGVHLDEEVLLGLYLFIPLHHFSINPVLKWMADKGVNDIGNILPMKLLDLFWLIWESPGDLWIALGELQHLFHLQLIKLGNVNMLGVLAQYFGPFTCSNIS